MYGQFAKGGMEYEIHTPKTPSRWFNYLFNDTYYMEVSQTGQGNSMSFLPNYREFNGEGYKYFYIQDQETGEVWCPAYQPLKGRRESFRCTHSLGWTELRSTHQGITAVIRVFVPREGMCEIWSVTLKNESGRARRLSLFSAFSIENGGVMGSKCQFDADSQVLASFSFPYHVFYEEKEKCEDHSNLIYLFSDRPVESYDCSERRFFGTDDPTEVPEALENGRCSNTLAESVNPIGAFQHVWTLEPGTEEGVHLVLGCGRTMEDVKAWKLKLLEKGFPVLLQEVEDYWRKVCERFHVETPDEDLNHFMNYWLKKQIVMQARNNRMTSYCPIRNQLQDALGYAMVDPEGALGYMESVLKDQERSGYIKQWIMTDGSPPQKLCLLKHKDGPVWLLVCFLVLVHQAGELSLLDRQVGFKDSEATASIYEHLLLAAEYMAGDIGAHGLCLMGHGDWNDPINGPGRLGRGESAWSTMALLYSIRSLLPLCERRGDAAAVDRLRRIAARLDQAINDTCWDGFWYVAGFDDEGDPFGTAKDDEGKLFLNTQTWAIMSGAARGERLEQCLAAIDSLDTAAGPLLLDPAFSEWNPKWGRISIKLAGTTENGSIYCHASMFKAFADCRVGRGAQAYETIMKTLPTNPENPPERNLQVPIFVPNFYFGLKDSPNFGQSSLHNSTGTVGWMLWTTLEYLLGVRSTVEGVLLDPCIPAEWSGYQVTKEFRGARYRITVENPEGVSGGLASILVNGQHWQDSLLPYAEGEQYEVLAVLGSSTLPAAGTRRL
ncbi:GH36-type glycosyl hydrolase domain-containing protein [Gorillibacterium sp. sgz5001074]|uniref:GH36-type glycosyl hydrolase domain-containing protein n=1 Tax=Gorillibacterium sp. sgz5001074 TaxID=3446695 RepID=UPI003F673AE8